MDAKTTRIMKEARPLFGPWCAVATAGMLPLISGWQFADGLSLMVFCLGIPLLASLAFGNEFQHRTVSLLLSQPVGRLELWREKLMVTVLAVMSAALVFSLTSSVPINNRYPFFFQFIAGWTVAIIAAAAFWTLLAKSVIGGVTLNIAVLGLFMVWSDATIRLGDSPYSVEENAAVVLKHTLVFLCYAGVMLWLGGRKLARFQATGAMAGDDLLTAGPDLMPRALAGWLRSTSGGADLNLLRKEFRLLRPVWVLAVLSTVGWAGFAFFECWHPRKPLVDLPFTLQVVGLSCTGIIAILAGCLSLGEEKTSGRHAWHMTLPVSAWRQWLAKFFVALFTSFICAGLIPSGLMMAGRNLFPKAFYSEGPDFETHWLVAVVVLTAIAFWSACATNGTVAAFLSVVPILAVFGLAPWLATLAAGKLVLFLEMKLHLFAHYRFDVAIRQFSARTIFSHIRYVPPGRQLDYQRVSV